MSSSIDSEYREFECYLIRDSPSDKGEKDDYNNENNDENNNENDGQNDECKEEEIGNIKGKNKNVEKINSKMLKIENNTKNKNKNKIVHKNDADLILYNGWENKVEKEDGMADCLLMLQKYLKQLKDW